MSEERKDEEEIVEQGSSSQSTESGHMVDTHVQQEESPETEEHEIEEHEGNNSDSSFSDEGGKNLDEGDDQLNGDYNYSPKPHVDGDGSSSSEDTKDEEDRLIDEGHESFVETRVVPVSGGVSEGKEKDKEELKEMQESKNLDELKGTEELKGGGEVKSEVKALAVVENRMVEVNGGAKEESFMKREAVGPYSVNTEGYHQSFPSHLHMAEGDDGTDAEQAAFARELEIFFRERGMEFKHPKFYGEGLNCLKLWRAVTRLGGYDRVTACKLWRQVGESFHPPKTCTTVSWSFRIFYEKALLDYERHKMRGGELVLAASPHPEALGVDSPMGSQGSGSGRARRDAAARAMQGWHSQKLLGNGEDKIPLSTPKREKHLKSVGLLKRKKPSILDRSAKAARTMTKVIRPQIDTDVADIGPAADWVKISVRRTKDCFEVYALVPGLLREEVRVQSDPAGRLVISGDPEQPDNPWGVTPFKKVITLPSRIDPHQTSAVVTLHGQLFVRVPFEQTDL
ncbi:AT-rich interactive domain-containing protein 3 [Ranunculus cassubicifolius]